MDKTKKSPWSWLNPLTWIDVAFSFIAWVFGPILRALGYFPHPDTEGFENIERGDVEDEARLASEQQAAVDELQKQMSPADVLRAYARSDATGRANMDLSALNFDQQHWLLSLSDTDLALLGMSTTSGCARSLEQREVLPLYAKPQPETETPEIIAIPSVDDDGEQMKRDFVAARFRELFYAPGVPNPAPRFSADTLH